MQLAYSDQERAVARSKERIRKQSEREQDELVDALKATGIFQGGVRKRKGKARRSQDSPQKKQKGRPKTVPSGPVDPFLGFPNEAKAERKAKRQKVSRRDKNDLLRRRKMERRFAAAGQTLEEAQAKLERRQALLTAALSPRKGEKHFNHSSQPFKHFLQASTVSDNPFAARAMV
eukprot:CAMPEP_0181294102 /NCGR_PEP_ID=MMETSP1101-20121128/3416_1 /TAXON_ID=46948 /ORGANISM="Rhodomonas abbreviata, Strain Caron Lab Isolate" /LENGTH=174 /DNA_ID=CAMNT_0023398727 /DNA_START=592 /DNA_END=1115 /DNA_ORIENTATION=+